MNNDLSDISETSEPAFERDDNREGREDGACSLHTEPSDVHENNSQVYSENMFCSRMPLKLSVSPKFWYSWIENGQAGPNKMNVF